MGLDPEAFGNASDPGKWPKLKEAIGVRLLTKPRDEWARLPEPYDTCFAPVLAMDEAPNHPHHLASDKFLEHDGVFTLAARRVGKEVVSPFDCRGGAYP